MDTLSLTKEARIYNGLKTISLTSGAGKSGLLEILDSRSLTPWSCAYYTVKYIKNKSIQYAHQILWIYNWKQEYSEK